MQHPTPALDPRSIDLIVDGKDFRSSSLDEQQGRGGNNRGFHTGRAASEILTLTSKF